MSFLSINSSLGQLASMVAVLPVALASASIAQAATPVAVDDVPSVTVSIADLNLDSTAGARTALSRIRFAAHEVCGVETSKEDIGATLWRAACVRQAIHDAVSRVDRPMLTALTDDARSAPAKLTLGGR